MKYLTALLILAMLFSTASCGKAHREEPETSATQEPEITEPITPQEDYTGVNILKKLPEFSAGSFVSTKDCGDKAYMNIFSSVSKSAFLDYINLFQAPTYRILSQREINGNLFVTAFSDGTLFNFIYTAYDSGARLIAEPCEATDFLEAESVAEAVCTPTVTQIAQDYNGNGTNYQSGMSYVIRLYNGSFLIVDGGYYRFTDAMHIMQCMREQAPDPENIVIAAWILTHAHNDHISAFIKFVDSYASSVTLKRIICNFPAQEDWNDCDPERITECLAAMKKMEATGTEIIKVHPGYLLSYGGITLDFLFTTELYYPDVLDQFNISSTIFRLNVGGTTFLFLGDMFMESNRIISYLYGETLKSDIVQVAHHGAKGGSTDLYKLIDPSYAFWPVGTTDYERYKDLSRNIYISTSPNIKKVWVARGDTVTVDFDEFQ